MPENQGVWGIDIGQAGLKAIRLRYAEAAKQVLAVAFDYVPHAKILSQPDAVPEELIPQALEKFLSRNDLKGDRVAISLPSHSAFTRFIKLPPVESSKVSEIVKYEARQQIPFPLEDVIWDFQNLGGGVEESGYMLEAEVGLFAMKRDAVQKQLKIFSDVKIEVDVIQIASLAMYNVLSYDHLGNRLGDDAIAPDEHTIVLDMGADNTTLLVSNGEKIWLRNVPIGGNHFTRALSKEMKLTFAKAEHLKCNATRSPDPRAVFQALRPVFNDYVAEIQRSIGYFSSVNRDASIKRVLGTGNGFKLAGLQKFLQQNLQYEVDKLDRFQGLAGDAVLKSPLFEENVLTFAVPYGLALQALKQTKLHTNLLPPEIARARTIERKKPWAVAAAAALQLGIAASVAGSSYVAASVSEEKWKKAEQNVQQIVGTISSNNTQYEEAKTKSNELANQADQVVEVETLRDFWPEVYKAIDECLPRDEGDQLDESQIAKRKRVKIESITTTWQDDLSAWFAGLPPGVRGYMREAEQSAPPTGPGFVFRLEGLHYYHDDDDRNAATGRSVGFVVEHFLKRLQAWEVTNRNSPPFPVRKLGITHATIVQSQVPRRGLFFPQGSRTAKPATGQPTGKPAANVKGTQPAAAAPPPRVQPNQPAAEDGIEIRQTRFSIAFAWKPTLRTDRPAEEPKPPPPPADPAAGGEPPPT